ncbi:quinol monooxygenase YgiN [Friedmanniella endophytica]|uniref:Quinol monooxygenase YgiN n=1 Tax=Microlunatus kandeliicorticis TaxID=1759536 RepID=A0A7W3P767_9ACTN|nr:antibiotic biosynthesis monooxygenase family protein [Microlunatus kandeliicorticis]MBA8795811.1 quinol monooxygenase YgiN [Microlunatus kandeliicorticis]
MIAVCRFRVPEEQAPDFRARAEAAVAVLSGRDGFLSADLGPNVDDPALWVLATRWTNVGAWRRALGGYEAKVTVVPLLSLAVDEPSAFVTGDDDRDDPFGWPTRP